jgi:hypothetical protein
MSDVATWEQVTPLFQGVAQSTLHMMGGYLQNQNDRAIATMIHATTKQRIADQRIANRITMSSARLASASSGQDTPNLDIIMQLAAEGERNISRLRQNGQYAAYAYEQRGKAAVGQGIAEGFFDLSEGFAESIKQGFLQKTDDTTIPSGYNLGAVHYSPLSAGIDPSTVG